jgi:RimJ/RimL family protein N-acetyltransferase
MPDIETSRLTLRPFTEVDVPALVALLGAREIAATTLRIAHPYTEQHARDFLIHVCNQDNFWLAITRRSDGQLCGGVGLMLKPEHQQAEIGYWIGVPFWGQGYATEAAEAMLRHGFDDRKLHRIAAMCMSHNPASAKILRKLGMRHEGCQRQSQNKWGEYVDVDCYGILRSEWEGRPQFS